MWAVNYPYYSESYDSKRKPSIVSRDVDNPTPAASPTRGNHGQSPGQLSPGIINEMFEPAVDGPPSPERIRQLSKQAKRASHLNRPHGHRVASSGSGSSSLRSLTGDRPSWELALENMSLTRRPSNRSTGSSAPSRDRPESMAVFGKSLLHRRGKSNRESSSHSSSGSSLYSTDLAVENGPGPGPNPSPGLRDTLMPSIFTKRPSRDESAHRRPPISSPFNFQHVTHTKRDDFSNFQRGSRMELTSSDGADSITAPTTPGATNAEDLHFVDSLRPARVRQSQEDATLGMRPPLVPRHTAPAAGPRRLVKHARSQDQLRPSPPHSQRRPSLPPMEPQGPTSCPPVPPIPPPRFSSRQSVRYDEDVDPLAAATMLERPLTGGGFRRQWPYSPGTTTVSSVSTPQPTPPIGHAFDSPPNFDGFSFGAQIASHALTTPDDSAWPLGPGPGTGTAVSFESPLPDVPEEEEHAGITRWSRTSLTSNSSSLRGSQSVPALRSLSQMQQRISETSDTLGDLPFMVHGTARSGFLSANDAEAAQWSDNWEDDIDYCYEHEAEASCDYQWERPSVDVSREGVLPPVYLDLPCDDGADMSHSYISHPSPNLLLPGAQSDMPALSPVSQASTTTNDIATPVFNPNTSNFSLPRGDRKSHKPLPLKQLRPISTASSFKESQGFTLSPSLLVPGDYHHQMLMSAADKHGYIEAEVDFIHSTFDPQGSHSQRSPSLLQQRSSTSTTETTSTSHSDVTGDRHISTNSTWSNLTRLTTSSTSLNKMAGSWTEKSGLVPELNEIQVPTEEASWEEPLPSACKDTVPELIPFPSTSSGRKPYHRSHASESVARNEGPAVQPEPPAIRRQRARTTSMSNAQAPPVGQYSLFPRGYAKASGDRI